jgi:hypothetical protein
LETFTLEQALNLLKQKKSKKKTRKKA